MAIKKFKSVGGFAVGEEGQSFDVIDSNANVTANTLTVNGDAILAGNLSVNGTLEYINTTVTYITDPIVEQGGGANGAALLTDDSKDRGQLYHYFDPISNVAVDAFAGWQHGNSEFIFSSNANVTDNVVTINDLGNIRVGNAELGNLANANFFQGDGGLLSNITATGGTATTVNSPVADTHITGGANAQFLQTDGNGNLSFANVHATVSSNITNVVAGSAIGVSIDYTDLANYPAGKFVIYQLGPVSLTMTDIWKESGSATKDACSNYVATPNVVNTQNVNVTFSLANANFSIQSTDHINIGSSNVTGANLLALNITGNSGTYTIPSTYLVANTEANGLSTVTAAVTASLTTDRGVYSSTGTTLTATAPVPYSVNSITGSFPTSSVAYWNLNQTFNWSVSVTGTTSAGNLTYSGGSISTTSLSSSGGISGTSGSIDSTSSYTITTSDYYGAGLHGYGNRTIPSTVNGTVSAATKYYPLFWKITSSSTIPTFTTSDTHNSNTYATGQGATTSTTRTDFLWLAIPNYPSNGSGLASHTFKHVFGGFDIVDDPTGHTGTQTITANGQSYNYSIYGFTGFTTASFILTTS
jgi:hypothetical protein